MFHRILVAIDATPAGPRAVKAAAELASLAGATVHVLHIDTSDVVYDAVVDLEDEHTARRVLDGALKTLQQCGVQARGELVSSLISDVPATVRETARCVDADLIVFSPHRRSHLTRWFTPSVSDAMAHTSRVPVLLVPDPDTDVDPAGAGG